VRLIGVEAAGLGLASGKHGASLSAGSLGVLHGSMGYLLQDDDGQIIPAHCIIPALECAHALAYLLKLAPRVSKEATVILCLSGRGDKDVAHVEKLLA
jgi:tryptophan synthase beta chain